MKNKNEIDDIILSNVSFDELMVEKFKKEACEEIENSKKIKKTILVKEFSNVPSDLIFSEKATYRVFNRKTKNESFINGIQFESFVASNKNLRKKLLAKKVDSFVNEEFYIRFDNVLV